MEYRDLNENNYVIYAAKCYYNPLGVDYDEFIEDLNRFKLVKKLIVRYIENDKLNERLILNHLIVIFNVFTIPMSLAIFNLFLSKSQLSVLKPFLIYLKAIRNDEYVNVPQDWGVVEALRKI